jgi:hypothetical protein
MKKVYYWTKDLYPYANEEVTEFKFFKQPFNGPLAIDNDIPKDKAFRKDGQLKYNIYAVLSMKRTETNFEILSMWGAIDGNEAPRTHGEALKIYKEYLVKP